jgi:hypothetical protein
MGQFADQGADLVDDGVGDQIGRHRVRGVGQADKLLHLGEVGRLAAARPVVVCAGSLMLGLQAGQR